MGEAKKRGTYKERKAAAIERQRQRLSLQTQNYRVRPSNTTEPLWIMGVLNALFEKEKA